jgi:hypothetical protein
MASILDAGLASIFGGIFVFLLVYAVAWGVLSKSKIFGDKSGPYAIIAFCAAFLMAVAPPARNFVMFIAPWYIALALVIFFILFVVSVFGIGGDQHPDILKDSVAKTWFIIIVVLIFIAGLAFSFGQQSLEVTTGPAPTTTGPVADPLGPNQDPYIIATGPYNGYNNAGPQPGEPGATATNDFMKNLVNTILHPKVLGLLITFLIASIAVYFLSAQAH